MCSGGSRTRQATWPRYGSLCAWPAKPHNRLLSNRYVICVGLDFAQFRDFHCVTCWNFREKTPNPGAVTQVNQEGTMGSQAPSSRPFRPSLDGCVMPSVHASDDCGVRRADPMCRVGGLLQLIRRSHRGARRALAGSLVGAAVLRDTDTEQPRQLGGVGVRHADIGAFDAAQCGGGDLGGGRELGLGEPFDDAPVSGVALVDRDGHDLLDRCLENAHDPGQQIHLWGPSAALPCMHGGLTDISEASKVGNADFTLAADLGKCRGVESAQHATRHAWPAPRFIVRKTHRGLLDLANTVVIDRCLILAYGVGGNRVTRRESVKLPRPLTQRPTPQMPELAGLEPRFDAIPLPAQAVQPAAALRPLYWWANDLGSRGDILLDVQFDASHMTATVTVRLESYRVVTVTRHRDDKPRKPHDLPALVAEAVWRLGALGWADEINEMVALLHMAGIIAAPRPVSRCTKPIYGWVSQPDRRVRIALWWADELRRHGWRLHSCGEELARHGFIAEIPDVSGDSALVVYPGDMSDDGTEASALANHLARLSAPQRGFVQWVIDAVATGDGRVI